MRALAEGVRVFAASLVLGLLLTGTGAGILFSAAGRLQDLGSLPPVGIAAMWAAIFTLVAKEGRYAHVKLPSGEVRMVLQDCYATIGQVSNLEHEGISMGKAGRSRWTGWRPVVRGVAMNPIDHPHGGGEGRTKGGRHPVSPWGQPTKGYKTRVNKRTNSMIVRRRSKTREE